VALGASAISEHGRELALVDKDERVAVVISSGRSWDPYVKLLDRRQKVRASLELGAGRQPGLYVFDEEGTPVRQGNAFERARDMEDPERIRAGMERLIDQECASGYAEPEREAKVWLEKLAEVDHQRA
jgi:hypothetical protein